MGLKNCKQTHGHNSVKSCPIFKILSLILQKNCSKWVITIPPQLAYVATLNCETLMSENKRLTINYDVVQLHIQGMVGLSITTLRKVYY